MTGSSADRVAAAARHLLTRGIAGPFACAIVLGTGLGEVGRALSDVCAVPYGEIPHFPRPGVSGHSGRLLAGNLDGSRVLVFEGRAHAYEAGDAGAMRVPVGVAAALGARRLLLTSAAGSLRADLPPGALVLVTDHVNLSGLNPLIGETDERRFVPMADAYSADLRRRMQEAAAESGPVLGEGVYGWFTGPSFETAAEIRMAAACGVDLVGMSVVPEVILARFHGLETVAVSLVTNMGTGMGVAVHTHDDTKAVAAAGAPRLASLVRAFLAGSRDR